MFPSADVSTRSGETGLEYFGHICCLVLRRSAAAGPAGGDPNKRNPGFCFLRRGYERTTACKPGLITLHFDSFQRVIQPRSPARVRPPRSLPESQPSRERGTDPPPGASAGDSEVDFQAAHFISIQQNHSIYLPALLPPSSLSLSSPSPVLFSSPVQVGGASGTSRRRSAELYTAASHPLLDGRMGEGEKEWGQKK